MTSPLTPRAFDAIVAQFTAKGHEELTCYADMNGEELEWSAFFETEVDPYGGYNYRHEVCEYTRCKLVGAWASDDDGNLYAGNRDEVAGMIGLAEVEKWERNAEKGLSE